jgi:hypothetical protein
MKKNLQQIAFLLCCVFSALGSLHAQSIDPYLQAIQPHSIAVNWKTSSPVTPPLVRYGLSETSLTNTINGTSQAMNDIGYSNNYFYHTVKLNGLQAATKYHYRVVSGADSSSVNSFRTLPEPGNAPNASGRMRFLIMGDNQIKAQPRYDSMMMAAKRKLTALYGTNFNDSVSFILNLGDQVDIGTLDHYENVHLKKSRYLSNVLPIQTAVGNHETYNGSSVGGIQAMDAYRNHFVLDSMNYKGIYSGTEDYYAFQSGNVVIVYMNTENTSTAQFNWVKKITDSATVDATVKWIITIGHRPYQAEQYVGDISPWIRNTVMPYVMQSPKFFLHVGAHHHLYARGQMKDVPGYNIISGGTAWDQYWGMASEQNFDDVQKTISNWAYQLVDVDVINDKIDVTTYSIGSIYGQKDNVVIDSFHRYKNIAIPVQPEITNIFPDSLQLPVTLTANPFQSTAGELMNSSEFQIALNNTFSVIEKTSYRHYQDLFGNAGAPDTTADQNLGVNISEYEVPSGSIPNGWHYTRVRYRDRNQSWSPWSATDSFKVYNSIVVNPVVTIDTNRYSIGDTIHVTFSNGSPNAAAWIGIYKKGQTPGSATPSQTWHYTNGANGTMNFTLGSTPYEYYVAYFGNSGYTEIATRVKFYYGPPVSLSTAASNYDVGQPISLTLSNAPALANDWIGIYKIGMNPGGPASLKWQYVGSTQNGSFNINAMPSGTVSSLPKGYYFASYFTLDTYFEASDRTYFSVGDTITTLSLAGNQSQYNLGEYISASWFDGPGNPKDWLGIYADTAVNSNFVSYTYIDGLAVGTKDIPVASMPSTPGNYYIVLFTNDSYNEVSNRVSFEMIGSPLPLHLIDFSGKISGMSHLLRWTVAGENPQEQYTLQHSTDSKKFNDIYNTKVKNELQGKYEFLYDEAVKGENYYRLKMIADDGKNTYSKIVSLNQNTDRDAEAGLNMVKVYPNPSQSNGRSIIESPYPITQIDVMNMSGQMIFQSKNIDNNKFSLFHQDLPAGAYILKIHSKEIYTAKMVITK